MLLNVSLFVHLKPPYSFALCVLQIVAVVLSPFLVVLPAPRTMKKCMTDAGRMDTLLGGHLHQIPEAYTLLRTELERFTALVETLGWMHSISTFLRLGVPPMPKAAQKPRITRTWY